MYRTHNCNELNIANKDQEVTLSGWVQKKRDKGGMIWIDLRDRYGITQLVFEEGKTNAEIINEVEKVGREFVLKITGKVLERIAKNPNIPTGEIEVFVTDLKILNASEVPPFTIEDDTDGGDDLRMKYRYLDLRRNPVKKALQLRYKLSREIRKYLDEKLFMEIETPYLIKSTPEGARDFVVPSRLSPGNFYALPQSPQVFKQLLMVSGYDRYFQFVKCFRDEDFRADRQPEFTQIDCEMAFVEQEDILTVFEGLAKHTFKSVLNIEHQERYPRIPYHEAMEKYGSDKPDIRFGMTFKAIKELTDKKEFVVFNNAEYVGGICANSCANYSRKDLDKLTKFVQKPQIGAKGLVYVKCNEDGSFKSSVDKFYAQEDLAEWAKAFDAKPGDLLLILAGKKTQTLHALCELRLEMGDRLGLRDKSVFAPLWVTDFPLFEKDEETGDLHAKHHPFTAPKPEDEHLLDTNPEEARANAYDFVINGVEIGGGSIRIYNSELQEKMFQCLGFTKEEAQKQFGFLMNAFKYGAPPHGGIAFGFDRWSAVFGGSDSIRDYIAFPKNNSGRDVMIDSPGVISEEQLKELSLKVNID